MDFQSWTGVTVLLVLLARALEAFWERVDSRPDSRAPNWLDQAAARHAARVRWMRLATASRPNFVLLAGAESELFAAGGDMCDLRLLRQRAQAFKSE